MPAPNVDPDAPAQMLVTNLSYDDYKGKIIMGRLYAGTLAERQGDRAHRPRGEIHQEKIAQLFIYEGLERLEVQEVAAGEIIAMAGIPDINIGETIADANDPRSAAHHQRRGADRPHDLRRQHLAVCRPRRHLGHQPQAPERLDRAVERDVALRVEPTDAADTFLVSGRGELHLAILIETMRREGTSSR
jgi:GTP-binding protein